MVFRSICPLKFLRANCSFPRLFWTSSFHHLGVPFVHQHKSSILLNQIAFIVPGDKGENNLNVVRCFSSYTVHHFVWRPLTFHYSISMVLDQCPLVPGDMLELGEVSAPEVCQQPFLFSGLDDDLLYNV